MPRDEVVQRGIDAGRRDVRMLAQVPRAVEERRARDDPAVAQTPPREREAARIGRVAAELVEQVAGVHRDPV